MSRPAHVLLVLALSALVAGCTGTKTLESGTSASPSDSVVTNAGEAPPTTSTPPVELSEDELREYGVEPDPGKQRACMPPGSVVNDRGKQLDLNKTFAGSAHMHDYWRGRTEATIWDEDVRVSNNPAGVSVPFATAVQWLHPKGAYVYPGAGKAVFTVTWQDALPAVPEARQLLWDMPGDEYGPTDLLSHVFLKSGETYELTLNLNNADPPHLNRTTWVFQLQNPETGYWTNGHITWTIYRAAGCLPVDPPHYDLWRGSDHMVMLDDSRAGTWVRAFAQSGGLQAPPIPRNVTTYGASMVRVTISWTDAPGNAKLGVRYCSAEYPCGSVGQTWTTPTTFKEESPTKRVYEIPIQPIQWDSPYYSATTWGFSPYMDNGALSPAIADYGRFEGSAHWLIEVLRG